MAKKLEGRVAVVTGASRGIGEAIALELAANGATVIACSTKVEGSMPTVQAIEAAGGKAKAYGIDVADSAQVDEMIKSVIAQFGRVDILVNNAGITRDGLLMRMTDEDWDRVMAVNLKGTFNFTRAVSRPMMKTKPWVIFRQAEPSSTSPRLSALPETLVRRIIRLPKAAS